MSMLTISRRLPLLPAAAALATVLGAAPAAFAFGGSAPDLPRPGNFVISNRAGLGFSAGLNYRGESVDLAPELDYFVLPGFSVGGAVLFHWDSGGGHNAGIEPQIGYDVTLSPTWSFWPRLAMTFVAGQPWGISTEISAPFLVHPVQHFFVGFGPAVSFGLIGNDKIDVIYGTFLIGGYFDS